MTTFVAENFIIKMSTKHNIRFINISLILIVAIIVFYGCNNQKSHGLNPDQPSIILAPDNPAKWDEFRENLHKWREQTVKRINYTDGLYNRSDFQWVNSAFNCYFLMLYDEAFYDRVNHRYMVDELLDDGIERFGGYQTVVLWHAYPRIGLDDRNQFDFYRDMPGGLEGLREVFAAFHARGVKVFINYNPWDTGTRREGITDIDALVETVKALDADGIFLDTMDRGSDEFRTKLDAARMGVVLESELNLPVEDIETHHMSWAQEFRDSRVPGILRNKWIEQRHIQHGIHRHIRDKSRDLQTAWMNGSGLMIWETIFGQWVGWNPRDSHILKTMSQLQQRFATLFSNATWTPLVDTKPFPSIYASLWEDENTKLWTLVNRSWVTKEGELLHIDIDPDYLYYDLVAGRSITPDETSGTLSGKMIPRGIGCFYACKKTAIPADLDDFLQKMASISTKSTSDVTFPGLKTTLREQIPTRKYDTPPTGMIEIDPMKGEIDVVFTCREIGYYQSIDDEFINRGMPTIHQPVTLVKRINTGRIAIDETPVTNLQFKTFLDATNYQPQIRENFLKHWINGQIPSGKDDHPVVYVCLDDARAYAKWAGKRLPREEEWQIAAGGKEQLAYPWGIHLEKGKYNEATDGTTTSVKAFPHGRSPYGVWDMCGNTWELTESEYSDGRIRFCILKGGSCYHAVGSIWYFDGGIKATNFAAKQMLLYPGIDRCATVGFRCVVDM